MNILIKARVIIVVMLLSAIIMPITLFAKTNIVCQMVVGICPLMITIMITVIFYKDYGYWPWQKAQ